MNIKDPESERETTNSPHTSVFSSYKYIKSQSPGGKLFEHIVCNRNTSFTFFLWAVDTERKLTCVTAERAAGGSVTLWDTLPSWWRHMFTLSFHYIYILITAYRSFHFTLIHFTEFGTNDKKQGKVLNRLSC